MKKRYKTIGCLLLILIISIYIIVNYITDGKEEMKNTNNEDIFVSEEIEVKDKEIVVEIKGEVNKPNIYYLKEGSIIEDLIEMSGGLTSNANVSSINRAQELVNHQSIVIPNKNEKTNEQQITNNSSSQEKKININTASEAELDSLPGIGPAKAQDIIEYREKNGLFKNIEEIKNVSGIGQSVFDKMKENITI